jgi:hypothetical protein
MDKFLAQVQTGQFSLHQPKPMKIKGGISSVRKLYKGREGGIWKYSMLGSQNAISGEVPKTEEQRKEDKKKEESKLADDIAKKVIEDMTKKEKTILPGQPTPTEQSKQILKGQTLQEPEKKTLGGDGGMQNEESRSDTAVMPDHEPPYYLPQEQSQLNEMTEFLKLRYGDKETRRERDFLNKDSKNFSLAVDKAKEINKAINKWKAKDLGKEDLMNKLKAVSSWFLDKVVDFGTGKIDFKTQDKDKPKDKDGKIDESKIDKPKEISLGLATDLAKEGVKELKKIAQKTFLSPESYEATMRAIQDTIFAQKPDWKSKWESLLAVENARLKKFVRDYFINFEKGGEIPDKIKDKVPFGRL